MSRHRFVYLLGRARHHMFRALDKQAMTLWGITSIQLGALFVLDKEDGCQLGTLANRLDLDRSAITGLSKRLVNAGVASKRPCELDRRAWRLYLTDRGRRIVAEGRGIMGEINEQIGADMQPQELDTAAAFLENIIKNFSNNLSENEAPRHD